MVDVTRTAGFASVPIDVEHCEQAFGSFTALKRVDLHVRGGELVTLLGPSGSGKTTLLRILAGLIFPTSGVVKIGGRDVTQQPAEKRDLGMVFQNYALFPHLNVFENIAFPLRVRRTPSKDIARRVEETLALVGLPLLGDRFPGQLSGGQQQRVAIARAIVFKPRVLLMDEPLGSLDKRLRQQLQIEIRRLQKELGITTVYVTHDQDEAFTISDRIAVMEKGEIAQIATPSEVYRSPANHFVADFVGDLNCFRGVIQKHNDQLVLRTDTGLHVRLGKTDYDVGRAIVCGIRPERIHVGSQPHENTFEAVLQVVSFKGNHHRAEALLPGGQRVLVDLAERSQFSEGASIRIGWSTDDMYAFTVDAD